MATLGVTMEGNGLTAREIEARLDAETCWGCGSPLHKQYACTIPYTHLVIEKTWDAYKIISTRAVKQSQIKERYVNNFLENLSKGREELPIGPQPQHVKEEFEWGLIDRTLQEPLSGSDTEDETEPSATPKNAQPESNQDCGEPHKEGWECLGGDGCPTHFHFKHQSGY